MNRITRIVVCLALATLPYIASAQYADRPTTPDRFKFDLAPLYASDDA